MELLLDKGRPICPQIAEYICTQIACLKIKAGERLPSVRDIALETGVNPNTVQKSFEQLERDGLIYSVRGSGWYAADAHAEAMAMVNGLADRKTASFLDDMAKLGFDVEKVIDYIRGYEHE